MGRFLFVVVILTLGWWGYDSFFSSAAKASPSGLGELNVAVPNDGLIPRAAPVEAPVEAPTPEVAEPPTPDRLEQLIAGLGQGKPQMLATAFSELAVLDASQQSRLATTLLELNRGAATAGEKLALLGRNNAFLRTEAGRSVAKGIMRKAMGATPSDAIGVTSRLLRLCMRGPLDDVGSAFVWAAYAEHLGLVQQVEFNPASAVNARQHKVKSGESLDRIAKRYRKAGAIVDSGTLQVVNGIKNPNAIQIGQRLRIPLGEIRTVVEKRSFLMAVYIGDHIVRLYRCAHGKPEHATPVTSFRILDKIAKPDWYTNGERIAYGHPDNPLGTHFIKFAPEGAYLGFGIHGTWQPERIGSMVSMGCVRLLNEDVLEYYTFIPRSTTVVIRGSE